MLITAEDVRTLSFYSYTDPNIYLDGLINEAETQYLVPVLGQSFYNLITANPNNYTELLEIYIKPCLSFYTKYYYYNSIFNENFYGANNLNDISNTHITLAQARLKLLIATFKFAKAYETALIEFIIAQNYSEYTAPDPPANPDPYPDVVPDPDPEPDPDPDPDPDPPPDPTPTVTHKLLAGFYI